MNNKDKLIKIVLENLEEANKTLDHCNKTKKEHYQKFKACIAPGYTYEYVFSDFIKDYEKLIKDIEEAIKNMKDFLNKIENGEIQVN